MAVAVLMPKVGITVESCLIGAWNKKVGESVVIGDTLFSYETDKAVFECESTAEGVLLEIFFGDGEEVPVLTPVCSVGAENETTVGVGATQTAGVNPNAGVNPDVGVSPDAGAAPETGFAPGTRFAPDIGIIPGARVAPNTGADSSGANVIIIPETMPTIEKGSAAIKISPRAKKLAERLGLDYSAAVPSGPYGRVIERDIEELAGSSGSVKISKKTSVDTGTIVPAGMGRKAETSALGIVDNGSATEYVDSRLPKIRRVIAAAMVKSLSEIAQLTHHHSFDASRILALREEYKKGGGKNGMGGVTIGDIVLYAIARTLRGFPDFNAHLIDGDIIRRFSKVNLGVAIDTSRGLLVPTIFNAGGKTPLEISNEVKTLAAAARSGSISPDKLSGGTFTVSNLGASGVEMFTPIINPPQVAIIGICAITTRLRKTSGGNIETYQSMGLSLTYDHRAVDGAPAAAFAQKVCACLERIDELMAEDDA